MCVCLVGEHREGQDSSHQDAGRVRGAEQRWRARGLLRDERTAEVGLHSRQVRQGGTRSLTLSFALAYRWPLIIKVFTYSLI